MRVVKTASGIPTVCVRVRIHQSSALTAYLFILFMDGHLTGVGEQAPWCVLFANDTAQNGETLPDLETQLGYIQQTLEHNGLRISRGETGVRGGEREVDWGRPPQSAATAES